jgi:hypothetical protein
LTPISEATFIHFLRAAFVVIVPSSAPRGALNRAGWKAPLVARRSVWPKAEGSRPLEARGRWQAALTTPGRPGTARQLVPGKRDGKVYARNQCHKASQHETGSNLVDMGRGGVHARIFGRLRSRWVKDGQEAMGKDCGVPMARPQGHSWTPTPSNGSRTNVGTDRRHPPASIPRWRREGSPSANGVGRDTGPVVVVGVTSHQGGRESRPQGKGGQRDRSGSAAMPGGRR